MINLHGNLVRVKAELVPLHLSWLAGKFLPHRQISAFEAQERAHKRQQLLESEATSNVRYVSGKY